MSEQTAIWHAAIANKRLGPLTEGEVLAFLREGQLTANDLLWRPGFSEWKKVSEVSEFSQPPPRKQPLPSSSELPLAAEAALSPGTKWSLWKAANIGLLVTAAVLLLQIGTGQGFELADFAHSANAETIGYLVGRVLSVPVLFVLIAVVRNLLNWRKPASPASAVRGTLTFIVLLVGIFGALVVYGASQFSSAEIIRGEARNSFVAGVRQACVRKQRSLGQNVTDSQIDKYCTCTGEYVADRTTYKQIGTAPDAAALAEMKQTAEAAGNACR